MSSLKEINEEQQREIGTARRGDGWDVMVVYSYDLAC